MLIPSGHSPDTVTAPEDIICKVWGTWVLGIRQCPPIYNSRVSTV